jgi:hypothetical protein
MVEPAATASPRPDGGPPPPRAPLGLRAAAPVAMAVALALFFLPALATREQFLYRDSGRMHWPVKQYVAGELRQGRLPQWNPYAGLGMPLVSGAIDAVQHPFGLLLVALPFALAFKLWGLLSFALAAFGAHAWARALGRSRPAAAAAGLGFALSGALVGASDNLTYLTTLAAVPWVFAAAHRWLARPGPGRLAAVGLASALCAAGGDPQAWGFAVALLPAYAAALAHQGPGRWRSALRGLQAAGAALVGAAPVILPVLAWIPHSSRGAGLDPAELDRWNLPVQRLLELVLPHMYRDAPGAIQSPIYLAYGGGEASPIPWVTSVYVGASVMALALLAARGSRPVRWLLLAAAGLTWMALGPGGGLGWLYAHAPVLSGFRYWEKMATWPSLLLPLAAAFGIDALVAGSGRRAGPILAGLGLAALLAQAGLRATPGLLPGLLQRPGVAAQVADGFAGNLLDGLLEAGLVTLLLGLVCLAVGRGLLRRGAAAMLSLVVVGDVFAANVRGYQLADPAIVQQPAPLADALSAQPGLQRVLSPFELTRDRFRGLRDFEAGWLWGGRTLASCFNLQHRIGNFETYAGMVPTRADRLRRRLPASAQVPRVGLFGVGYLVVPAAPANARSAGLGEPYDVVAVDPALPAFLLRFPHRPRAYLASELTSVDRRGAMEFALSAEVAPSRASAVEAPVPEGYRPPAGEARVALDEPERVVVEVESDGPALLVLNDVHAPGWTATVDGRAAAILDANYLARGVWVEGGTHRVQFRYRTPLLREGWALFLLGAAALAAAGAARRRRRR